MNPGDMFKLEGYELMAAINYHSSDAVAVVIHNNSTHLITAVIPNRQHGPLMMQDSPDVFWGLVASMYLGNVILLLLNLPLVPLFAQILRVPAYILYPGILGISVVGAYSVSGRLFDIGLLAGFGLLGWLMGKLKYPAAPLILGFVLGGAMERALRQSLTMSQGDVSVFLERPLAAGMLALAVLLLASPLLGRVNTWRVRAVTENG